MIDKKALLAALDEYEPAEEYEYEHDLWLDIHILVASFEEIECHCNLKKNAELIAKILDSDSNNEIYECCETCENYFSENAAETCLEGSEKKSINLEKQFVGTQRRAADE